MAAAASLRQKRGKSGLCGVAVRLGGALRARCTRAWRGGGRAAGWCAPRTLYEGGKRCAVRVCKGCQTCADWGRSSAADVRPAAYAPPRLRRCAAPRLVRNPQLVVLTPKRSQSGGCYNPHVGANIPLMGRKWSAVSQATTMVYRCTDSNI